jgi:PAS domain S-box-containing protein
MTKPSDKSIIHNQGLTASEERLRALVTATSDIIYSLSADWKVMRELDGRGFLTDTHEPTTNWQAKNIHPDHREKVTAAINEAIRDKKIFQLEHKVLRVDGTPGWTFSRAVPILDDQGEIIEWFGVASDITEHKEAQQALEESKEQAEKQKRFYETITAGTPDLIYVFDLNYRFTYANSALLSMWGKTWDNAVGKGLLENGYEPWHAEMHEREIDQVKATKQPIRGEVSFPHATLGKRIYDYIFTPVFNEHGEVEAIAGTTRDVTERKQWEEALERSSIELQAMNEEMAATNEEMAATNEEMAATNEEQAAFNEELNATNEELAFVNQQLLAAQQKIEEGEVALRLAIDAANFGSWFIHSATREFITDARLKELFGYYPYEDLSIEQALAQISEEYRGFVATKLENAIYNNGDYDVTYPVTGLHDNQLRWLRAIGNLKADPSGAFSAFTGVVMDITDQYLSAQKIELAEESLRMAIESGELATWYLNEKLGTITASARFNELFGFGPEEEVPYDAAVTQILPEYQQMVQDAVAASFKTGAHFNVEYPVIGFHDGKQRWVRSVGKFVADEKNGNYITGVMADITEQKMDDIRKNDFIGMVSHELKTPLTSLNAIVQVANAKLKTSDDQFLAGAMTKAIAQVKRMSTMINGFLNISRLESGKVMIEKSHFNIDELIHEITEEMKLSVASHQISVTPCPPIDIYADRDKINSVVSNLISNAVKYSPKDTMIKVSCTLSKNEVTVSISDQGIGIKSSDADKIFDRYYRVESSNTRHISGFGIGLYLSAEIIERHGGKIWLESEPGKGSTFYFSLPL